MRLIGHGIDLIECERIARILEQHGDRFLTRILTDAERRYCQSKKFPIPHVAARFAAKEAVLKVLGTGWRGPISWTDIEITNDRAGKPSCTLSGPTRAIADQLGIVEIHLTLTHTQNYAAASALGVGA